jgi:hypothetical protein
MAIGNRAILRKAKALRRGRLEAGAGDWGLATGGTIKICFSLAQESICQKKADQKCPDARRPKVEERGVP